MTHGLLGLNGIVRFPKFAVVMVDKQRGIDGYYDCLCTKLSVQYFYCNTLGRSLVKPACRH